MFGGPAVFIRELFVAMGLMGCLEIENIGVKTADFLNNLVGE
jgi:hypothetical protein